MHCRVGSGLSSAWQPLELPIPAKAQTSIAVNNGGYTVKYRRSGASL